MNGDLSVATVLVSALVSIATGYVGALLSTGRLRRQEKRVYGLALMAEVKSIYRGLLRYQGRIGRLRAIDAEALIDTRSALGLWRRDLSVFTANSGKIGLFSAKAAVELIEFYHRIRLLEAHSASLGATGSGGATSLAEWLDDQHRGVRIARQHARYLGRLLRRELPLTIDDMLVSASRGRCSRGRLRPRHAYLRRAA